MAFLREPVRNRGSQHEIPPQVERRKPLSQTKLYEWVRRRVSAREEERGFGKIHETNYCLKIVGLVEKVLGPPTPSPIKGYPEMLSCSWKLRALLPAEYPLIQTSEGQ